MPLIHLKKTFRLISNYILISLGNTAKRYSLRKFHRSLTPQNENWNSINRSNAVAKPAAATAANHINQLVFDLVFLVNCISRSATALLAGSRRHSSLLCTGVCNSWLAIWYCVLPIEQRYSMEMQTRTNRCYHVLANIQSIRNRIQVVPFAEAQWRGKNRTEQYHSLPSPFLAIVIDKRPFHRSSFHMLNMRHLHQQPSPRIARIC